MTDPYTIATTSQQQTLALFDSLRKTVARIAPEPWVSYRTNCDKALRFYRGTHRSDVESTLRNWFPQAMDRDELRADVKNFVRKPVDRAANLWSDAVARIYEANDTALDSESPLVQAFTAQDQARTHALQLLDRRCYLCQSAVLSVGWDSIRSRLSYHILTPSAVWIVPSLDPNADPDELQDLDAFVYELASRTGGEIRRFCFWSHEYQFIYEARTPEQPERILPATSDVSDPYANPLGLLPFVIARESDPEGVFWPPFAEDLVDSAVSINVNETLQRGNIHYQSHGQLVVPEGTNLKQPWGRGVAWQEPKDAVNQTRFLTRSTPFAEVDSQIQREMQTLAFTRNLPPNDFAFGGTNAPESGFSKLVDSLPLMDLRASRIAQVGVPTEAALVTVEASILSYYLGVPVPSNLGVSVTFPAMAFPVSDNEKATARKTLREAQQIEIAMGLLSAKDILMEEEGLSEEEAIAKVAENTATDEERIEVREVEPVL